MKKSAILIIPLLFFAFSSFPQIGGNSTYTFLNLTNSARIAGIGADFIPVKDNDISLALSNPSIISESLDNRLALSFLNYYADTKMGFASFSKSFKKIGSFSANVQFINYGDFTEADVTGQTLGIFSAQESAISIGWGRQLDSVFSIGANFKSIFSRLADYSSFGLAVDVAGTYFNKKNNLTATFIAKNIGAQLSAFAPDGSAEPLPFQMQVGLSKKFEHVPLRFILLYNHLEKFNLSYNDPDNPDTKTDPLTGEAIEKSNINKSLDKLMRHFVVGAEFIPVKYFSFQFGYNYQRRKELGVDTKLSTVGFSWGMGIKISKLYLNYSRARFHLSGSPNFLTLTTNLSDYFVKK